MLVVLACVLGGGCVHDAIYPGVDEFPGTPTRVSRDSDIGREIEAGYQAYGVVLAPYGQWHTDPAYGVRWCPRPATSKPFTPYVSSGHWVPAATVSTARGNLPPEAPYWAEDAAVPRGDITMHHGWWVRDERVAAQWCWVPGVKETPARVLWRESDGFVGWAPEPPGVDGSDDESYDDLLSWVYELTGTLFEDAVEDNLLSDAAADAAELLTGLARRHEAFAGHPPVRVGPSQTSVRTARAALADYAAAHPTLGAKGASASTSRGGLPSPSAMYAQMAEEGRREGAPGESSALPSVRVRVADPAFNHYAGHAGAGNGCACASHSGGHTSSASHESAGHAGGGSGGDCGSHSSHHK